jgi:hypothetical protein
MTVRVVITKAAHKNVFGELSNVLELYAKDNDQFLEAGSTLFNWQSLRRYMNQINKTYKQVEWQWKLDETAIDLETEEDWAMLKLTYF